MARERGRAGKSGSVSIGRGVVYEYPVHMMEAGLRKYSQAPENSLSTKPYPSVKISRVPH
jgi:hypothetical protein